MTTDTSPAATEQRAPKRRRRRKGRPHNHPRIPLTLELTGFAPGGKAVAHAPDGRVVFVEYGIPGERVVAEIVEEHSNYIEATTVAVERAAPTRVEPRCQYFGRCGGCQLQHIDYDEQLVLKTGVVREQLRRIGRFEEPEIDTVLRDMLGMQRPWAYRNHMRFTVRRDGDVGFMERGTHRFLRIDHCEIAVDRVNEVLALTQGRTMQTRQLSVRVGEHTGDELIQPKLSWRPSARWPRVRSGQRRYSEKLLGQTYRISAAAFFQVNSRQAERLVQLVIDHVEAARPSVVVDAYAGVGTFAAQLSRSVETVITIEESAAAGSDATLNLGDLDNVRRVIGKVEQTLPNLRPSPDVVVIDPPRVGIAREVIDAILASTARRVVYVSCDPATLARDLRLLVDGGLTLTEVQPVDMFPQTQHIECVTVLDRSASKA